MQPDDKAPAFQFYPKDFLGDGDQAGMSLQETGAYARLMCYEWNAHGAGIPDDATRAANMVHAQVGAMRKMWPTIRSCFIPHPTEAGRLVHPRLEKERVKQAEFRRRQSDASKKRWDSRGNATASKRDIPQSIPKPSSSVSNLQSSSSDSGQIAARSSRAGVMAGALPLNHRDHLACFPVCLSARIAAKYLPRFNGDEDALQSWAVGICRDWQARTERGERVPEGDDFAFWAARYDEHFKHGSVNGTAVEQGIADHIRKRLEEKPVRNAR